MKYVSLDLETTCLQPDPKHILQISMVVEDTDHPEIPVSELPHFTCFVKHPRIEGEAYALGMNGWILDIISGRNKSNPIYPILSADPKGFELDVTGAAVGTYWLEKALYFLRFHFGGNKITVAGKNVAGFDIPFLPKELSRSFRHKVLDPGTLYVDWSKDDQAPNFEDCKRRAGFIDVSVKHDAREDAMDVILLLRKFYA